MSYKNFDRLYDELSGHREKPPQSNEYDPDDSLGLSSGRVTSTMTTLIDPWEQDVAEAFIQDGNGKWVVDKKSRKRRDMFIRAFPACS